MKFTIRFAAVGISLAALTASSFSQGPKGVWMLTDGDNKTDVIIQGAGVTTYAQDPNSQLQYPIQWNTGYLGGTFDTIGRDQNGLGGVYTTNHTEVDTFLNFSSVAPPYQHLDGTLDTKDNMSVAAVFDPTLLAGGQVIGYGDGFFNSPTHTIWTTAAGDNVWSVTYAQSTGDLYVGGAGFITVIDTVGNVLGGFAAFGGGPVRSLAYDALDNSLWYLSFDGSTAIQTDLSGNLLQADVVNLGGNYWGGEIAPIAAPEPATMLALGGGLLALIRRRRSR